jgi:hypothetical protein
MLVTLFPNLKLLNLLMKAKANCQVSKSLLESVVKIQDLQAERNKV